MKWLHVLALLILPLGATTLFAQEPEAKDKSAATHDEIRAVRDGVLAAIKAKDVDALLKHLHPDIVLTSQDGMEQKVIRKHDGVRSYIARQLTGPQAYIKSIDSTLTVDELTILHGDTTGIAFGSSKEHYVLTDGKETDLSTRWSATLIKHDGSWKVANLHYSTNLFDNPVLDGAKKMMYWVAGIAAAIGLVVGVLLTIIVRR